MPLFFMISGALLLKKEESIQHLLKTRFLKYFAVLLVVSFIQYLYKIRGDFSSFSLFAFLRKTYTYRMSVALWFLYAYLGYLLCLPMLRKMANAMSNLEYEYMLILFIGMSCITILQALFFDSKTTYYSKFSLFFLSNTVFYPLLGYYLEYRLSAKHYCKKNVLLMIPILIVVLAVTAFMTHRHCTILGKWESASCQKYLQTLIVIPCIFTYFTAKLVFSRFSLGVRAQKFLRILADCSFGIYLFENIYRQQTKFIFHALSPYVSDMLASFVHIVAAFALGFCITLILKKIPVVKNLVG